MFVDDEERILQGLSRTLYVLTDDWEMTFVASASEALQELEKSEFDVIVADMRMPKMDGAELLQRVHSDYPGIVRIVLSGHAELKSTMRAAAIAHQFLTKPCDADTIHHVVERACGLQTILESPALRGLVGGIERLPSRPAVYQKLCEAATQVNIGANELARIVEQDVALTAKLLQLVNSSFFGLKRDIKSIEHACTYLGTTMLRNLALSASIFAAGSDSIGGLSLDEEQRHAWLTASLASSIVDDRQLRDEAFLAGMLHDVGKLVLARAQADQYETLLSNRGSQRLDEAEIEYFGASHAEVGGYLLGLWGLDYAILEAVVHHHRPSRIETPRHDLAASVHIATALADGALHPGTLASDLLDREFVDRIGVAHRIDEWMELAMARANQTQES